MSVNESSGTGRGEEKRGQEPGEVKEEKEKWKKK